MVSPKSLTKEDIISLANGIEENVQVLLSGGAVLNPDEDVRTVAYRSECLIRALLELMRGDVRPDQNHIRYIGTNLREAVGQLGLEISLNGHRL